MNPVELRERRIALGLSQTELSELLGRSRATIARWEAGTLVIGYPKELSLALEALERRPRPDTPESVARKAAAAGAAVSAALKVFGASGR